MDKNNISPDFLLDIYQEIANNFKSLSDYAVSRINELTGDDNFLDASNYDGFIDIAKLTEKELWIIHEALYFSGCDIDETNDLLWVLRTCNIFYPSAVKDKNAKDIIYSLQEAQISADRIEQRKILSREKGIISAMKKNAKTNDIKKQVITYYENSADLSEKENGKYIKSAEHVAKIISNKLSLNLGERTIPDWIREYRNCGYLFDPEEYLFFIKHQTDLFNHSTEIARAEFDRYKRETGQAKNRK